MQSVDACGEALQKRIFRIVGYAEPVLCRYGLGDFALVAYYGGEYAALCHAEHGAGIDAYELCVVLEGYIVS